MSTVETTSIHNSLLASLLAEESFTPEAPKSLREAGISASLVESLIFKFISAQGATSGRDLAERLCLPFAILEELLHKMRTRQFLVHTGTAPLGDFIYNLSEKGQHRAKVATDASAYIGPAPVPFPDYIVSVDAQTVAAEAPKRAQLEKAFTGISVEPQMMEMLGPAVNSGAGMFLYGYPGNGKTTIAKRITACFGQDIWIPHTIVEDGQIVKLFDAAVHEPVIMGESGILKTTSYDKRWIKVRRPTVVVGGELTMDTLEIRHDPVANVCEAALQMKSNCGCLLIDDFGRQRMNPTELLNRWIVPLENRVDYLTLPTGKKIQVPFEQLIIFSTNLEPKDLVDEAFLRRIPYKLEIGNPSEKEYHKLFQISAQAFGFEYVTSSVEHLLNRHYRPQRLPLRRCHPRDLLKQVRNYCVYNDLPLEMLPEYFDRVVPSYFTMVGTSSDE